MTQEYLTLTLQDLETLLSKSGCSCHFINPNKTRLIIWKERRPNSELSQKEIQNDTETYYLRIGIQKFISYPLKDKNKMNYWKFNPYGMKLEVQSELSEKEIKLSDSITKFQQRPAQAINYGKSNNESAVNNASAP